MNDQLCVEGSAAVRDVPLGRDACVVCDQLVELLHERRGIGQRPRLKVHRHDGGRCTGSHEVGAGWLAATRLPRWDDLTDLDKGAALMHAWKAWWERSAPYATENYPARYIDHPALVGLGARAASRHARVVTGGHCAIQDALGADEHMRLYNVALAHEEASR